MTSVIRWIAVFPMMGFVSAVENDWRSLFNGTDLSTWSKTIAGQSAGEDPDGLVRVCDGEIHMYPNTQEGTTVPFGVITHEEEFSRFYLRFEYRWEGRQFPPRDRKPRAAGLIYHVNDASEIRSGGVECQAREGDVGDLVLLQAGASTWMEPDPFNAPEGQEKPGMLPENGGRPASFTADHIVRFEEADKLEGWNQVEVIVHGAESAEHIVNGRTLVRLTHLVDRKRKPLSSGRISLRLEGAGVAYRNVRVRVLEPPLKADRGTVSLSAVEGNLARTRFLMISNPGKKRVETPFKIIGKDAESFEVIDPPGSLEAGAEGRWTLAFRPIRGAGRYSAGLQVGDKESGAFVVLQGIGLATFEGKNEPPLQSIMDAFGIPLDVGGETLSLDSKTPCIGECVDAAYFQAAGPGKVFVTPLARFSPPGLTPFGVFTQGEEELREIGKLAACSGDFPDAHQALLPPLEQNVARIEFAPGNAPFGFYMEGHAHVSFTDPSRPSKATIPRTARVYPIHSFQGKTMRNTWAIGFEEAKNGDYQDTVLMVENVVPVVDK